MPNMIFLGSAGRNVGKMEFACEVIRQFETCCPRGSQGSGWRGEHPGGNFSKGKWQATAAVLAGGRSSRMGRDKSLLPLEGQPMIERVVRQLRPLVDIVLIGANDPLKYGFLGCPVIPDEQQDQGPLMGIYSCLRASPHDRMFVTACDIPELPVDLIVRMLREARKADVVMPIHSNGRKEPLLAVYSKCLIPMAQKLLASGKRKILSLLEQPTVRVNYVDMPPGQWYHNLNTYHEYREWVDRLRSNQEEKC